VLVPNLNGAERALQADADLMLLPLSASHAHSLANLRKTPQEVVAELARIRAARDASGRKTLIEGGVGTAFGCTIQGEVSPAEVLRLLQALLDAGADRVESRRHCRLCGSGLGTAAVRAGASHRG
jgi:hydroxymethylglutaryl-CoA lyase